MNQKTIETSFTLEGLGLHTGRSVCLTVNPAPANTGIVFAREGNLIPASVEQLAGTERGTSLHSVGLVEHFLSAAAGLGITNLSVELDGDELPALDGSALPYIEAFESSGILEQIARLDYIELKSSLLVKSGEAFIEARPAAGFKVDFVINFEGIGEQRLVFDADNQSYVAEIAPARTFGFLDEHEALKKRGLALGASPQNALVLSRQGYVNQPRFPDEPVRHKILDLIGDLALLGRPLKAEIKASRSGHALNAELVRRIVESCPN